MYRGIPRGWLLAAVVLLFLTSCSRGSVDLSDVGLDLVIDPDPPQIGPAIVEVSLYDVEGQIITGAQVALEGNMSHAGMVPVLAPAAETWPGVYRADLEFTMGGDWFILVRAKLPDGRSMERKVDVPGVDVICGETPTP
jgi:hypothetical protein